MHVDRAGSLRERRVRIRECLLHKHRVARDSCSGVSPVDIQLVLALDGDIDPRLRRMKVQVTRTEMLSISGLDSSKICQHAVVEAERLNRTRIDRIVCRSVVAAGDENYLLIVWSCANLMRV